MTDDIVTRLRDKHGEFRVVVGVNQNVIIDTLYGEAADEIERLRADRNRWAKWGEHVFTCPNKGVNPCRDCVSPLTADAMSRVDTGGAWYEH